MKTSSLALASFRHYWRDHLGLLFGVFLAAAILAGSLMVGDSVRASLQRAAGLRLGKIQAGLLGGDRWFTESLARKSHAVPLILVSGSVTESGGRARANAVQVLGVDESFWSLSPGSRKVQLDKDSLAVNDALARKLGVKVGDTVLVRLEKPGALSRDAPLSGEANQDITLRRKVSAIIGGGDFGNFQLQASQIGPQNVFMPLAEIQEALGRGGDLPRVNAMLDKLLVSQGVLKFEECISRNDYANARAFALRAYLSYVEQQRSLEDFSLKLTHLAGALDEWEITTDRVFLDDAVAQKILQAMPGARGVLTYLVNGFSSAKGRAPYSFVTASSAVVLTPGGREGAVAPENAVTITQWLADDLQLAPGDSLDLRYFVVGDGRQLKEQTAAFTVGAILPMSDPQVNPSWTPDFPGVSDAKNCRDWQPGIPMKLDAIRPKDEDYWKQYRTTPKAFISPPAGQKLWSNRFGKFTAIRFPGAGRDVNGLREQLVNNLRLADIGLVPRDFNTEAQAAAKGSVDFGGLFVGLSMFIMASSLIFSVLLYNFTIEKRATQIGLLLAIGWREKQVSRWLLAEAGLIALLGTTLGLLGGAAYTKLALFGLNSVWSDAAAGLKLSFQAEPTTLAISFFSSLAATLGTLWWGSRRLFKIRPRDLLAGELGPSVSFAPKTSPRTMSGNWLAKFKTSLPFLLVVLALCLSIFGSRATNPEEIAGMFFGAGFMLLIAGLLVVSRRIKAASQRANIATSLAQIGVRNITRRPGRSLAVIGMMAGGIFLVIAVNAFRLGSETDPARRDSGTGGFALIGESTLPVYEDLNSEAGRDAFALDDKTMRDAHVVPFRVREGDDASCLNLNKAQRPVLTAVNPKALADRRAFLFTKGSWQELSGGAQSEIPAIADQATAMWGLGKGVGDTIAYTDSQGREYKVKLVGLLAGSVLQGKVIISEENFLAKYPDAAGYKYFLIDAPQDKIAAVSAHLTRQLETRGLALELAADRLAAFNAVQNTYIGIFTVLGGLGVLLGTAGLGVLTMRNVLERRGEFGLMQALGFQRRGLQNMVLSEHVVLLVGGLILGLLSAAIAVWPNVKQSGGALPVAFLLWLNLGILIFGIIICRVAAAMAVSGKLLDAVRRE